MIEYKYNLIESICKYKRVLHIGASDSPFHNEKAVKGLLLHQKIERSAKKVVGLDIDKNAISDLKKYNIRSIYFGDILTEKYAVDLKAEKFDVIVFADVIEHLDCPGNALKNIKKLMTKKTLLIITAPNVFNIRTLLTLLTGCETVHSDHVFWTSKKTIERLFKIHHFKIIDFHYVQNGCYEDANIISKLFYYFTVISNMKYLRNTLYYVLQKS